MDASDLAEAITRGTSAAKARAWSLFNSEINWHRVMPLHEQLAQRMIPLGHRVNVARYALLTAHGAAQQVLDDYEGATTRLAEAPRNLLVLLEDIQLYAPYLRARLMLELGEIYELLGDHEAATDTYWAAEEIDPNSYEAAIAHLYMACADLRRAFTTRESTQASIGHLRHTLGLLRMSAVTGARQARIATRACLYVAHERLGNKAHMQWHNLLLHWATYETRADGKACMAQWPVGPLDIQLWLIPIDR